MSNTHSFPEGSGNFYSFGARRLGRYLAMQGMQVPDEQALQKLLLDHFDEIDYNAAKRLLAKDTLIDWHMIVAGEVDSDLAGEPVQAAHNFRDALASVLEICDRERIFPTAIDHLPDGIRLRIRDQLFAEIRRIPFEPFQSEYSQRVENALKGVRASGENERMVARLRSIPGFRSVEFRLGRDHRYAPHGRLLLPFPTNWATTMMSVMDTLGSPVKRHIAQELVACIFGANCWHHLIAHSGDAQTGVMPYALATSHTCTTDWRYYRSVGESVCALGQMLKSWNGEPLFVDQCGPAALSDGFLIATAVIGGSNDSGHESPFCTPVSLIAPPSSNGYLTLAKRVEESLAAGDDPTPILGWDGDLGHSILTANVRLGSPDNRTLQLGNWWLRVFHAGERAHLSLEHFHVNGIRLLENCIALYKATLRHDSKSRVLTVTGNYDTEDVATIQNVSLDQCEQLRRMIVEPHDNPVAPASWGRGDIRGDWPAFPH